MSSRTSLSAAVLIGGSLVVGALGTGTASAGSVCDSYSGRCTTPPAVAPATTAPAGVSSSRGGGGSEAGELPFTGGEAVLLSLLGLGALGGGTALVLAGRRRPSTTVA